MLKDVSFKVEAGHTLAIIGATGAGKSTIINLLTRNYEINKGQILIDGTDYRKYDLHLLAENVAVVLQDVFLFSDTIYNNITLNRPISIEDVQEYAKDIEVEELIQSLLNGYDYNVMERGNSTFSWAKTVGFFLKSLRWSAKNTSC